jgi:hypothetical protein
MRRKAAGENYAAVFVLKPKAIPRFDRLQVILGSFCHNEALPNFNSTYLEFMAVNATFLLSFYHFPIIKLDIWRTHNYKTRRNCVKTDSHPLDRASRPTQPSWQPLNVLR